MDNVVKLVKTCSVCPEQYDAFIGDRQVGYLRLRSGIFTVEYPDVGGVLIYDAGSAGDGCFETPYERHYHLRFAVDAILKAEAGIFPGKKDPPDVAYEVVE